MKSVYVLQHTDSEFLGRMEDHLEGRNIRFTYMRLHTGTALPATVEFTDAVILLGGGPWGSAGGRDVPTLDGEVEIARACLERNTPVIGIGLGAQILAIAAGGASEPSDLVFEVGAARRVEDGALNGYLPERYPLAVYMRDRPLPPARARILAEDAAGRPCSRSATTRSALPAIRGPRWPWSRTWPWSSRTPPGIWPPAWRPCAPRKESWRMRWSTSWPEWCR